MSLFKKLKSTVNLLKELDLDAIARLSQKVDLKKMVGLVSQMKEEDLQKLMKVMSGGSRERKPPEIDGDFYDLSHLLTPEDRKSTRLNSSHVKISYAVFCLKKKT